MSVLSLNSQGPQVAQLQQALNTRINAGLTADGDFGAKTESAVKRFQASVSLTADGIVGPATWAKLNATPVAEPTSGKTRVLGVADYRAAGLELQSPPSMIHALSLKETKGKPFLPDGRPVILFERRWFWKLMKDRALADRLAKTERDICSPDLKSSKNTDPKDRYQGGVKEWEFLERAMKYDREAAIQSASYGQFQVMGFNAVKIGYASTEEFFKLMHQDVYQHLEAMVRFIKATPMALRGMRAKNFQQVAEAYNGSGYRANSYDTILKDLETTVAPLYK